LLSFGPEVQTSGEILTRYHLFVTIFIIALGFAEDSLNEHENCSRKMISNMPENVIILSRSPLQEPPVI